MKNALKLFFVVISLTIATETFGQNLGVRAGLNISTMALGHDDIDVGEEVSSLVGFHVGLSSEFPINDNFSFETGLLFTTKGYVFDLSEGQDFFKSTTNPMYLEIPLTVKTYVDIGNAKMYGILGPYLGFGVAGKTKIETNLFGLSISEEEEINWGSDDDDDFTRFDFGLVAGVGILYNSIQIGVTYGLGLANISPITDDGLSARNRVLGISVGYNFNSK